MNKQKKIIFKLWKICFVRKIFYPINKFIYRLSLRGMGILNYEDKKLSGEYIFLKKFFLQRQGEVAVFDIGAHIGNYSKMVRRFSKKAKIYAFEPNPETFRILMETAKANDFVAYNYGCGEKEGKFKFYDYTHENGSSHATFLKGAIEKAHEKSSIEQESRMIRLDNFVLGNIGVDKIDLLKVDTEGYDFMVLKGAERLIREKRIDAIQFEFNEMNVIAGIFFRDIYDFLVEYDFYRLLPDGPVSLGKYDSELFEIFAFQNIVAIRRDLSFYF